MLRLGRPGPEKGSSGPPEGHPLRRDDEQPLTPGEGHCSVRQPAGGLPLRSSPGTVPKDKLDGMGDVVQGVGCTMDMRARLGGCPGALCSEQNGHCAPRPWWCGCPAWTGGHPVGVQRARGHAWGQRWATGRQCCVEELGLSAQHVQGPRSGCGRGQCQQASSERPPGRSVPCWTEGPWILHLTSPERPEDKGLWPTWVVPRLHLRSPESRGRAGPTSHGHTPHPGTSVWSPVGVQGPAPPARLRDLLEPSASLTRVASPSPSPSPPPKVSRRHRTGPAQDGGPGVGAARVAPGWPGTPKPDSLPCVPGRGHCPARPERTAARRAPPLQPRGRVRARTQRGAEAGDGTQVGSGLSPASASTAACGPRLGGRRGLLERPVTLQARPLSGGTAEGPARWSTQPPPPHARSPKLAAAEKEDPTEEWDVPRMQKEVESLQYQLAFKREMSSKSIPELLKWIEDGIPKDPFLNPDLMKNNPWVEKGKCAIL
ncbi:Guanine nucleotide-binding protein G(I)/G(S)/G(O) subunit gamma-13 [Galemys pyrenaicus]|uniref:Guanine nucleotide-binding protein G(I)/G(S)/G(O) subunit gamma-13 n=1 Tax=Galemys pyrenaicus TaxID=202257 RepID=A0A8J6A6Z8_GALPY|nr:Guanine nucleotide-binding protein G(I)/G(S)/G(O) subunit gamma-13 [Galemys pyrenaicus]